jgi:hypothetical protein
MISLITTCSARAVRIKPAKPTANPKPELGRFNMFTGAFISQLRANHELHDAYLADDNMAQG